MSSWNLPPEKTRLDDLVRDWLDDLTGQIDQDTTGELYRLHWAAHLIPFFGAPVSITEQTIAAYSRARLKKVKRRTLQKERSTLRGFLDWCVELGYLEQPIVLPALPKRAPGTPWHQRRRGAATELSPEEVARVLAALPEWSTPRRGRNAFPVRARFVVAYETGLRPATLDALSCPEHYQRGAGHLVITDEIDKARFGRELPLTDAARAALESVSRRGLIFGEHDYRHQLKKAAVTALGSHKAKTFAAYDFRHSRLTHLAETGNLPGVAYIAGHKRVTTTALYVKPGLRAAERALHRWIEVLAPATVWGFESPPSHRPESHRKSLPASSSPVPAEEALAGAARALLEVAAEGTVSDSDLRDFARACLLLPNLGPEHGRLIHGVLAGGPHAPRRALELAQLVASSAAGHGRRLEKGEVR